MKPSLEDVSLLSESILPTINLIMKLEHDKLLPSNDEINAILCSEREDDLLENWPTAFPQTYGARKLVIPAVDPIQEHIAVVEENILQEEEKKQFDTNYEANNATIDMPIHSDLATDETVKAMINYAKAMAKQATEVCNIPPNDAASWDNVTPIMESFGVPLCGDGNPTWAINKILRGRQNNEFEGKAKGFFGGFHLVLEAHKKRGDIFGPTHLRDIFSCWRTTEPQLDWVMHPGTFEENT